MHSSTFIALLTLAASTTNAGPCRPGSQITLGNTGSKVTTTTNPNSPPNVIYWGQNGGNARENEDLAHYCSPDSGIDIVILAFLSTFGSGATTPSGTIGPCVIDDKGNPSGCDTLAKAIGTCKGNGKKIILSLGGASGAYGLKSQQEAETIGQYLWDAYGGSSSGSGSGGSSSSATRPFGTQSVDGFDFDIENPSGSEHYKHLISKLRSNFPSDSDSDSASSSWITGSPQCPIPEPNMNGMIADAQFSHLWIQFFNNPGCSGSAEFNFEDWKKNVAGGKSRNAKLFLGVPAAPFAATVTESGKAYYLEPGRLDEVVKKWKGDERFGGVMLWSAGFSDGNVVGGCTYAQQVKSILSRKGPCS